MRKRKTRTYKRKFTYDPNRYRTGRKSSLIKKIISGFFFLLKIILIKTIKPVFVAAVFFAVIFYSYKFAVAKIYASERFIIEDIKIEGCNNVTETEIERLIPFKIGDHLLKVDLSKAEEELMKCKPELKKITMSRKWKTNSIVVNLKEREPEVFVVEDNEVKGMDFDNSVFKLSGNMFSMTVPVLKYKNGEERTELLNFVKECKPYVGSFISNIKEVRFGDVDDIIFVTDSGTEIFLGSYKKNNLEEKINKMKIVSEDSGKRYKNVAYIDLTLLDNGKDRILVKPLKDNDRKESADSKKV